MQQLPPSLDPTSWQIITYRDIVNGDNADEAPRRYAVLRGGRRVAWGLHDQAGAARWLRRLGGPTQDLPQAQPAPA